MDSSALNKLSRLFWLGRYVERTLIEIDIMQQAYDQSIDGPAFDYVRFCEELEIPNVYESADDFLDGVLDFVAVGIVLRQVAPERLPGLRLIGVR